MFHVERGGWQVVDTGQNIGNTLGSIHRIHLSGCVMDGKIREDYRGMWLLK